MSEQTINTARLIIEGDDPLSIESGMRSLHMETLNHIEKTQRSRDPYHRRTHRPFDRGSDVSSPFMNRVPSRQNRFNDRQRMSNPSIMGDTRLLDMIKGIAADTSSIAWNTSPVIDTKEHDINSEPYNERRLGGVGNVSSMVRIDNALRDLIFPLEDRLRLLQDESASRRERFDVEHFLYYSRFLSALNDLKQEEETRKGMLITLQELNRKPFWTLGMGALMTIKGVIKGVWGIVKGIWTVFGGIWKGLFGLGDRRTTQEKILQVNQEQLEFARKGEVTSRHGQGFRKALSVIGERGLLGGAYAGVAGMIDQRREDARARGEKVRGRDLTEGMITLRGREGVTSGPKKIDFKELIEELDYLGNRLEVRIIQTAKLVDAHFKNLNFSVVDLGQKFESSLSLSKPDHLQIPHEPLNLNDIIFAIREGNERVYSSLTPINDVKDGIKHVNDNLIRNHRNSIDKMTAAQRSEEQRDQLSQVIRDQNRREDIDRTEEKTTILESIENSSKSQDKTLTRMRRTQVAQFLVMTVMKGLGLTLNLINSTIGKILSIAALIWGYFKGASFRKAVNGAVKGAFSGVKKLLEWGFGKVKDVVRSIGERIGNAIRSVGDRLKGLAGRIGSAIWEQIKKIPGVQRAIDAGKKVKEVTQGARNRVGAVRDAVNERTQGVRDRVGSIRDSVSERTQGVRNRFSNINDTASERTQGVRDRVQRGLGFGRDAVDTARDTKAGRFLERGLGFGSKALKIGGSPPVTGATLMAPRTMGDGTLQGDETPFEGFSMNQQRRPSYALDPTQTIPQQPTPDVLSQFTDQVERDESPRMVIPQQQDKEQQAEPTPIETKADPITNHLLEDIRNILNIMKEQYDPMPGGFDRNTQLNLLGE